MSDVPAGALASAGESRGSRLRTRRIALGIEYDGGAYAGWQRQAAAPSIQSLLESALARVADAPIALICAGRTDAGVHACGQVAHFDTHALRSSRAWLLGANTYLPADISVRWVRPVPDHFHARYSALARTYRYLILNRTARSALSRGRALVVHGPLDVQVMRAGAAALIGEHDFSAFRSSECQSRSPVRVLSRLQIVRSGGEWVLIEISANAFLHHMARNIVGVLLAIGQGRADPQYAAQLLSARVRDARLVTAAAEGLYFWRVDYPAQFRVPDDSAMIAAPITDSPAPS